MKANEAQKLIAQIIYSLSREKNESIKISKYIWFMILRLSDLSYHFSSEVASGDHIHMIVKGASKAHNVGLFKKFYEKTGTAGPYGCKYGNAEIIDLSLSLKNYNSLLKPAVKSGNLDLVKRLLDLDIHINSEKLFKCKNLKIIDYICSQREIHYGYALTGACGVKNNNEIIEYCLLKNDDEICYDETYEAIVESNNTEAVDLLFKKELFIVLERIAEFCACLDNVDLIKHISKYMRLHFRLLQDIATEYEAEDVLEYLDDLAEDSED